MASYDFEITQGTTNRFVVRSIDPEGDPYDFTGSLIRLRVGFSPMLNKTLTIDGSGVATGSTGISLGRPDPTDHTLPLIDATATSGYLTVEMFPADTASVPAGTYPWEMQVVGSTRTYPLQRGSITIVDSLFDS